MVFGAGAFAAGAFTEGVLSGADSTTEGFDLPPKSDAKRPLGLAGAFSVAMSRFLLFGGITRTLVKSLGRDRLGPVSIIACRQTLPYHDGTQEILQVLLQFHQLLEAHPRYL